PGIHIDALLVLLKAIDDPALKTESVPNRLFHRRSEPLGMWCVVDDYPISALTAFYLLEQPHF
ncbi:hypothetical protein, partial [Hydrogenibacillus schlegelii]|uniref:hypothetical protein n=1 Tax=Hydrogenibacillus schlegelii TaxID=1484 RepID=UPI0034A08040